MIRHFAVLLMLLLATGCQPPQEGSPNSTGRLRGDSSGKRLRIAVIPKGTTHEFWKSIHYGADKAARELGAEIVWQGPLLESDREGQIRIMQTLITKGVDGICLAPLDSQALVAAAKEANRAGIPVVIYDSDLDDTDAYVSYIATDNFNGGRLAADTMAERLDYKGNVILLRYNPGSESTEQREAGFLEGLQAYPDVKVISSDQYGGTTPELALDKVQHMLIRFGDEADGIFAVCEPNATGALGALEEAGLAEELVFIGFDPSPRMVSALAEKKLNGIVLQNPVKMGYLAVKTMAAHLAGKTVEKRIITGEYVATPENMDEPEINKLLNPAQYGE